ncbi:metal-binding protein [Chloracidobacterium aggregatum]|uniref:metal-binding protein n=1 Tax=Chloracidobacterium aggregatum TaxID=2851959 RepID=UPI001B8D6A01|nr:metal-binding protein [Chloracidobacterium aggregatum]QUV92711.1 metal-binding protein [Chloracidobacterium sp. A]
MPSGRTHDLVTYALAIPTAVGLFFLTRHVGLTVLGTATMLFGGLMFGPDLDTHSKQYTRWGILRWLWYPYKKLFPHRSHWTHGLLWSTWLRVGYFTLVMTLALAAVLYVRAVWIDGLPADGDQAVRTLQTAGHHMSRLFRAVDGKVWLVAFIGLWWGAATHTLTDVIGSALKSMFKTF